MWWRRVLLIVGVLPVAAVMGAIVLFIGMKGAANHAESTCADDLASRRGYGGWSMSGELWPPSFTCEIGGSDVPTLTISHPTVGLFGLVAAVAVPAIFLGCVLMLIWWIATRSFVERRTAQDVS